MNPVDFEMLKKELSPLATVPCQGYATVSVSGVRILPDPWVARDEAWPLPSGYGWL